MLFTAFNSRGRRHDWNRRASRRQWCDLVNDRSVALLANRHWRGALLRNGAWRAMLSAALNNRGCRMSRRCTRARRASRGQWCFLVNDRDVALLARRHGRSWSGAMLFAAFNSRGRRRDWNRRAGRGQWCVLVNDRDVTLTVDRRVIVLQGRARRARLITLDVCRSR